MKMPAVVESPARGKDGPCPTCSDFDEDCEDLSDKQGCWLYAPEKGMCPYLRPAAIRQKEE